MKSRIILHSFDFLAFDLIVSAASVDGLPGGGSASPALANAGVALPPSPATAVPTWIVSHGTLQLPGSAHTASVRIKTG